MDDSVNFDSAQKKGQPTLFIQSDSRLFYLNLALIVVLVISVLVNQFIVGLVSSKMGLNLLTPAKVTAGIFSVFNDPAKLSGNLGEDSAKLVISGGVPNIYGPELSVSFDDVQLSINKMKIFDPTYGEQKIVLSGNDLERYIAIASKIACEYCCGATGLVQANGEAACGCAHSIAMRGLLAYLITKHGAEYTDDQMLRELARWKGRYFPKQMMKKMSEQLISGNYTPDIASLLLDLKLPKYSATSAEAPLPSEIKDLPGMVGGC